MIPECIESNRFELIFNELTDGAELKALPIDDIALNGIIEEEEMEDEGSDNDDGDDYAHWVPPYSHNSSCLLLFLNTSITTI